MTRPLRECFAVVIVSSHSPRIVRTKEEEMPMITGLLLGLLADVVFDCAASTRRSFGLDMERYLTGRGFAPARKPTPTPAR